MWRERAASVMALTGMEDALHAAEVRTALVRDADLHSAREVRQAIRETCWWIAAMDDGIDRELGVDKGTYRASRDSDDDGAVVLGVKWARNRHSHQLVASTHHGDMRPFIPKGGGSLFFISTPYRWLPVVGMNLSADELRRGATHQPDYERLVGREVVPVLASAIRWFTSLRSSA